MTPLVIDRGTFRFGTKDKPGSTWESNPVGMTILIGDLIEDTEHPDQPHIDNAYMFHVTQRTRIMDEIAKRLQLPPGGETDVRDIAKSLMEKMEELGGHE
jgi:hypothetical protein